MDNATLTQTPFSLTETKVHRFASSLRLSTPGRRVNNDSSSSIPSFQEDTDNLERESSVFKRTVKERTSPRIDKNKVAKGRHGPPISAKSIIWDKPPIFFIEHPVNIPPIVHYGPVAIFQNGTRLKWYQALDLVRLYNREKGESVCNDNFSNKTGFILGYEMGYGKTATALALICCNPAKSSMNGCRSTLVLCTNQGIMSHWQSEVKKFAPNLRVCYYNSNSAHFDDKADIILATYHQLRNQHKTFLGDPNHENTPLYKRHFHRVIADEAHFGRNPSTKLVAALWALPKDHGLCLTGTPVQNSPFDLFSLFVFLNVTYLNINRLEVFQQKIYSRYKKGPIKDPAAQKILDTIMKDFCIVRTQINPETGRPLISLPRKTEKLVSIALSPRERLVYDYVQKLKFPCHLTKLMRLRQACDHVVLLTDALYIETPVNEEDIPTDLHPNLKDGNSSDPIFIKSLPQVLHKSINLFRDAHLSSKLSAVLNILKDRATGEKTLIFTHFTSVIPPLTKALRNAGLIWTEYTGYMKTKDGEDALNQISTDNECTIMIVSITAGGVGLNIIACSSVILMEPWWNPYVTEQAISRVYRIGQLNPVTVYHLVVKDSIEERIVETENLKRETMGQIYSSCSVPDSATVQHWLTVQS